VRVGNADRARAQPFNLLQRATSPGRARATLNFFEWSLDKGAKEAADIGYVPLPQGLVNRVKVYWAKTPKTRT
jgi:phosphate transport system substrate-binding protein